MGLMGDGYRGTYRGHTIELIRDNLAKTLKLHEERLRTRKENVQTGEVALRKETTVEHKTMEVPVRKEEVVIERRPASGAASSADLKEGEEIRIPVKEEKARASKETVVTEEVNVSKRKRQDTQTVSGDVRKERLKVEEKGGGKARRK